MIFQLYDPKDPRSIYNYSRGMIGKTFNEISEEDNILIREDQTKDDYACRRRKGGLGELIEEKYFMIHSNSDSRPDFEEAGVELKVTPYKINKNASISSKERMIITMINYHDLIETDFYDSGVWSKSQLILIVFYLWQKEIKNRLDYSIDYTYLYSPPKDDLEIIIEDYNFIKEKVDRGEAHKLSEGDTMYLGAATKASTSKDRRSQPNSDILAKPRAFSFKNSYMTYVLNEYVVKEEKEKSEKIMDKEENTREKFKDERFEDFIIRKINTNRGSSDRELIEKYYETETKEDTQRVLNSTKGIYSDLAFKMLGIKSNQAEEFQKANINVKSIRVEEDGRIVESMSFPNYVIGDLIEEEWEESEIYEYFSSTKFLFIIYNKNKLGGYNFKKAEFWNMPAETIDSALKEDWHKIVNKFKAGVNLKRQKWGKGYRVTNDLPKKRDLNLMHSRPHARLGVHVIDGKKMGNGDPKRDGDLLPNGDIMTKQSFWLNNDYLEEVIKTFD